MTPALVRRLAGATLATTLLLTACGSDSDSPTSNDNLGIAVGEPNGPGDAGDQGGFGDTRPAGEEMAPEQRAQNLLGQTRDQAEFVAMEFGWTLRVARSDDMVFPMTEDYQIDRITVELDATAPGDEPIVTKVTIELEDGPQTWTA